MTHTGSVKTDATEAPLARAASVFSAAWIERRLARAVQSTGGVKRTATITMGSRVSLLGRPEPDPRDGARVRVRREGQAGPQAAGARGTDEGIARGTDPDRVAIGTSPPGNATPRRTDRPNSRIGSQVAGYEILQRLGSGGTSVVYQARPAEPGGSAPCALKIMRRKFAQDREMTERLEQEATLLDCVRHAGLPRISGRGHTGDGLPYLAMELLEGITMGQRLDQGPMAVAAVLDIAEQTAEALAAVHAAGIVHCDLKPDNLFLIRDQNRRSRCRAMIIDFGVAVAVMPDGAPAAPRRLIGTPAYMAPEQAKPDGAIDARTDVYGFGCLLYEMLCGESPFGGNVAEILTAHQSADPPRASALRPDTPPALDALIRSMLAKDPALRPADMAEVRGRLSRVMAALPVERRLRG